MPQRYNSCIRNGQTDAYCSQAPNSWYQNTTNNQNIVNTNNGYVACVSAGYSPSYCSQNPDRSAAYGPGGYTRCVLRGNLPANCSSNPDRGWSSALYNKLLDTGLPVVAASLQSIGIPVGDYLQPFEIIGLKASAVSATSISFSWMSGGGKTVSFAVARNFGKVAPANCTDAIDVATVNPPKSGSIIANMSYTATGLTPGATYSFRFCAQNGGGVVTKGIPLMVTTLGNVYSINAGGAATEAFSADARYTGKSTSSTKSAINRDLLTNPAPAAVYQSNRNNNMTYNFDGLQAGRNYKVRLHFAEIYFSAPGQRKFDVTINDTKVLKDLDVLKAAGGKNIGYIREFTFPANAAGVITINFTNVVNAAMVSGIEIIGTNPLDIGSPSFPATAASSSQFKGADNDAIFSFGSSQASALRPWIGVNENGATTQTFKFNRLTVGRSYALRIYPAKVSTINSWWQTDITGGSATILSGFGWSPDTEGFYSTGKPWVIKFTANTPSLALKLSLATPESQAQLHFNYIDTIGVESVPMSPFYTIGQPTSPTNWDSSKEFTASNPYSTYSFLNGDLSTVRPMIGHNNGTSFSQAFKFERLNPGQTYVFRVFPTAVGDTRAVWLAAIKEGLGEVISGNAWSTSTPGLLADTSRPWQITFVPAGTSLTIELSSDPSLRARYSINAGGSASGNYSGDSNFSGGKAFNMRVPIKVTNVKNPPPTSVYQTQRQGNMSYALTSLSPGDPYLVRLHFAELSVGAKNQRKFNVSINGKQVLADFDIFVEAGRTTGIVKEFTVPADANGAINMQFVGSVNSAVINGIEVIETKRPTSFLDFDFMDAFLR